MKEITLKLRLTLFEYDTLEECVADELHRSEVFAGEDSVLASTCSSLLEKITAARRGKNTCSTCYYCFQRNEYEAWCVRQNVASPTLPSQPACKDYATHPDEP